MFSKSEIINLIDLTSLNDNDSNEEIKQLVANAKTSLGKVAAICIHKEFIKFAKEQDKNLKVATVINFPEGDSSIKETLFELEQSLLFGADEIDLVMPYKMLFENETRITEGFIKMVKDNSNNKILKVIIESGELKEEKLIRVASKIAINAGADFIKTSTGKVPINATLDATTFMLEEIKNHNPKCGFKAAGGIKTLEEAIRYLNLATKIMGKEFINNKTFRFGASSLLSNILGEESNSSY